MADTEYKNSIKEINKLYTDANKRKAARSFMLSCKESGIAYSVALDLLKSSASVPAADQIATKSDLKADFKPVNAEEGIKQPLQGEIIENSQINDDIERVTDSGGLDMAEIENKVRIYLDDFCSQNNIDDMTKAPFRLWRAASTYIGRHLFKALKILKCEGNINNSYDLHKIKQVLDLYIFLSDTYNKPLTIDSAEMFLGVHDGFLSENKQKLTSIGSDLWKKSEASIAAGIVDGKVNPTGALAHLNHYYNWNDTVKQTEKTTNNVYIFPALGQIKPENVPTLPEMP